MDTDAIGPLASLGAALVAALAALIGLIISKEAKVSDFRQAWIDELRREVACLISNLLGVRRLLKADEIPAELRLQGEAMLTSADAALSSLRLRLNEKEISSKKLLKTLVDIEKFTWQSEFPEGEIHRLERELHTNTRTILKEEWDRVRRGEATYRAVKYLAFGVSLLSLFGIGVFSTSALIQ